MNDPTQDAQLIWQAGVDAVAGDRLVQQLVTLNERTISFDRLSLDLSDFDRLCVVGAGKASAFMAAGLETALANSPLIEQTFGMVNVPKNQQPALSRVIVNQVRSAGQNLPNQKAMDCTLDMAETVSRLNERDLCVALISGGGSAMLTWPKRPVTLDDLIATTQFLATTDIGIRDLNRIRICISQIKGGGLAGFCHAGQLVVLVISDIMGDPIELVSSGPTFVQQSDHRRALEILSVYDPHGSEIPHSVYRLLNSSIKPGQAAATNIHHFLIGNNDDAARAAANKAKSLGYNSNWSTDVASESADQIGVELAQSIAQNQGSCDCLISGGEPVVNLAHPKSPGKGGRNQQLVLSAAQYLRHHHWPLHHEFCLLSGGTDGEDGNTAVAGAWIDNHVIDRAIELNLPIQDYLARNDSYHFFEQTRSIFRTPPTRTNVCDLRVVISRQ